MRKVICLLIGVVLFEGYIFGGWVYQSIGSGISSMYGLRVGDARNDGTNRVYVANDSENVYEFSYSGGNWFPYMIPVGTATVDLTIAPARNDGLNRIYITNRTSGGFFEYSYINGSWELTYSTTTSVPLYQVCAATGTKDSNWRIYCAAEDGVYEFSWDGSTWTRTHVGTVTDGRSALGVCVADGRNDGVIRVYAADSDWENHVGSIYEYTWTGSEWIRETVVSDISGKFFFINAGVGRNDEIVRLYAGNGDGYVYEISWDNGSGAWNVLGIGEQISGAAFLIPIVGKARPDELNRVYASCTNGKVYEYTWIESESRFTMNDLVYLTEAGMSFLAIGDGRNDGKNRIYLSNENSYNVYEIFYDTGPYKISGYVMDSDNKPLEGVLINLSGFSSDMTITDENGYYEFTNLEGGIYYVVPSLPGWQFTPSNYTYSPLTSDKTEQNFVGSPMFGSISGMLIYEGLTTFGTYYVWVSTESEFGAPAYNIYGELALASYQSTGPYIIPNLYLNTHYYLMAARDANEPYVDSQLVYPFTADPVGAYESNPIYLTSSVTDINITINDPPPSGTISGQISYEGQINKDLIVVVFKDFGSEPVSYSLYPAPNTYPLEYSVVGLPIGNTYYLLATMFSGSFPNNVVISEEDPWYIHSDPETGQPLGIEVTSAAEPVIINFTLREGNNPIVQKRFEARANSYHSLWIDPWNGTEHHNYYVNVSLYDNFAAAISVQIKGPGLADGNTYIDASSSTYNGSAYWSTSTYWDYPPNEPPTPPLYYYIKVTTGTDPSEEFILVATMTAFLNFASELYPEPNTNLTTQLTQFSWIGPEGATRYGIYLVDKGTDNTQWSQIWSKWDITSIPVNYDGPQLQDGHYYLYSIIAWDPEQNSSYRSYQFSYNATASKLLAIAPGEVRNPNVWNGKTGLPQQQLAGVSFTVTVYAANLIWATDSSFDSSITLKVYNQYNWQKVLELSKQASNGVAIFDVTIDEPGQYTLNAEAGSLDSGSIQNLVVTLPGYIAGKVTSTVDGSALQGTIIEVLEAGVVRYTTTCDIEGEYSVKVATGVYDVRASSAGYMTQTRVGVVVVVGSTTTVNFALSPAVGYIAGKVASALDGSALAGAVIEVLKGAQVRYTAVADASGDYSIEVATGTYDVRASSTGYMSGTKTSVVVVYNATTTVNFALSPAVGYIAGKVTSTVDGSALSGAVIEVLVGSVVKSSTTCNADGSYSIKVTTGTYDVRASSSGYQMQTKAGVVVVVGSTTTVNFALTPTQPPVLYGYIAGKVTSTVDGSGLSGALVEVLEGGVVKASATCDISGLYSIEVATGVYDVRASSAGYITQTKVGVVVVVGSTTTVNFALSPIPPLNISGYVREKGSGIGISGVLIMLDGRKTSTDYNGYYKFTNLSPGTYTIKAEKTGWTFMPVSSTTVVLVDTDLRNIDFEGEYEQKEQPPEIIDIPIGIGDIPVKVEMPKPKEAKLIVEEIPDKPIGQRGTVNPDKGEEVSIVFRPDKKPHEYIGQRFVIRVFNITGELVEEFTKTPQTVDDTWVKWLPKDLASGTYIIHVDGPGVKVLKKIVILR